MFFMLILTAAIGVESTIVLPAGPLQRGNCTEHLQQFQESRRNNSAKISRILIWEPKCLPDGTYAPTQFNAATGLKFCISKEGILLVAPQRSMAFFADCGCPRKRFEKFQSNSFDGYIFRCDTDFTYSVLQFDPATNISTCLMKDGQIIQEYTGTHIRACKCPRQWFEAKLSKRAYRYEPQCNKDGTFRPKQCKDGQCWCANGEGEQISSYVPEVEAGSLSCE